jgi:hypothetical protein
LFVIPEGNLLLSLLLLCAFAFLVVIPEGDLLSSLHHGQEYAIVATKNRLIAGDQVVCLRRQECPEHLLIRRIAKTRIPPTIQLNDRQET